MDNDAAFISDVAENALKHTDGFTPIVFEPEIESPMSGIELTAQGAF